MAALVNRVRSSGLPVLRNFLASSKSESSAAAIAIATSQGSRSFSTETKKPAAESKVRTPLALFGGTGNYASALFLTASKANMLDKVASDINDLVAASKNSPRFSQFIKDLSVPKQTRVKIINEIFAEAGFSDVTKNFLAVLADNGRLKFVDRIAKRFIDLTMAHKGDVKITVTVAYPLETDEVEEFRKTMTEVFGQGKSVIMDTKIDPSILDGFVVECGQKVLDLSIKTRLSQMEKFLREPVHF